MDRSDPTTNDTNGRNPERAGMGSACPVRWCWYANTQLPQKLAMAWHRKKSVPVDVGWFGWIGVGALHGWITKKGCHILLIIVERSGTEFDVEGWRE